MIAKVGITMGDPCGIGPEIIADYVEGGGRGRDFAGIFIGDALVFEKLDIEQIEISKVADIDKPGFYWVASSKLPEEAVRPGKPTEESNQAVVNCLDTAAKLCVSESLHGMVTCPVSKREVNTILPDFMGHTEYLAEKAGDQEVVMVMQSDHLRVALVTNHIALSQVSETITTDRIARVIELADSFLRSDLGISAPRIAVAALNPHAGEGLFGDEDQQIVMPAVEKARKSDIDAHGPIPADSLFYHAFHAAYDMVIAMYHDQGLIPVKMLGFGNAVNITIGLPFVRTSVDHGVAYDIAGQGLAQSSSLSVAVWQAVEMIRRRSHP